MLPVLGTVNRCGGQSPSMIRIGSEAASVAAGMASSPSIVTSMSGLNRSIVAGSRFQARATLASTS